MGNSESGPAQETESVISGRPRSPEPYMPRIIEEEDNHHNHRQHRLDPGPDWDVPGNHNHHHNGQYRSPSPDWVDQENHGDYRNSNAALFDRTDESDEAEKIANAPSIGFEVEEDEETDEETEDDGVIHVVDDHLTEIEGAMSLMEASAAVFHYLSQAESNEDHLSVADRSAAVFQYLEEESQNGGNEAMIGFLETASVVSAALLVDDDHQSVSDASAAVFHYLEQQNTNARNGGNDDDGSVSERSTAIFQLLDDARSVDPSVSEKSSAVFQLLDDAKSIDAQSISDFSSAVFHLLDDAKSYDGRSVSETSAAVFHMLEEDGGGGRLAMRSPTSHGTTVLARGAPNRKQNKNLQAIDEQSDVTTVYSEYSKTANSMREDYPEVGISHQERRELQKKQKQQQQQEYDNGDDHDDDDDASEEIEEIDLDFVEQFDSAFNEFIGQNPRFLMKNPDLVHNLRITKLQRLLESMQVREKESLTKMATLATDKQDKEQLFLISLREASRKKAARQINLQSDLNKLSRSTKLMQAKSTWKCVSSSELRVKRQYQLRQHYKAMPVAMTREALLKHVPEGYDGQVLRDAIYAPPCSRSSGTSESEPSLSMEQELDVRQFQVDNAFMISEVAVLKKKLALERIAAKKQSWVESMLLRMDEETMSKLKTKYLKKAGVSHI